MITNPLWPSEIMYEFSKEDIINAGLRIGDINYEFQPQLLNNTVIEQNMTAGMRVSFPASIHLLISKDIKSE